MSRAYPLNASNTCASCRTRSRSDMTTSTLHRPRALTAPGKALIALVITWALIYGAYRLLRLALS